MVQQPLVGQGFMITLSPNTLGRPPLDKWSGYHRDPTWQLTTLTRDRYPSPGRIWTHNFSRRVATDLSLRQCSHWDWWWTHGVNKENVPVPTITYCLGWKCGNRYKKRNLIFTFPKRKVFPISSSFSIVSSKPSLAENTVSHLWRQH